MRNQNLLGGTFALYYCKAWADPDNTETTISGLYTVEDIVYSDRTCGQWESGYWVFPSGQEPDAPMYFVDIDTFMAQTDPQGYGRMLVQERETEFMAEDFDKRYGDLFAGEPYPHDKPF